MSEKPRRRLRIWQILLIVLAVAAVGAGGVWLMKRNPPSRCSYRRTLRPAKIHVELHALDFSQQPARALMTIHSEYDEPMRLSRFDLSTWWLSVDFFDRNGNAWAPDGPRGRGSGPQIKLGDEDYDIILPARSSTSAMLCLFPSGRLEKQNLWFGPTKPQVLSYESYGTVATRSVDLTTWRLWRDVSGKGEVHVTW